MTVTIANPQGIDAAGKGSSWSASSRNWRAWARSSAATAGPSVDRSWVRIFFARRASDPASVNRAWAAARRTLPRFRVRNVSSSASENTTCAGVFVSSMSSRTCPTSVAGSYGAGVAVMSAPPSSHQSSVDGGGVWEVVS